MKILSVGETAKALDLSPDRVRQLERSGKLPALKTSSGQRLFLSEDVQKLVTERSKQLRKRESE